MSASLVGSEMCIRDSCRRPCWGLAEGPAEDSAEAMRRRSSGPAEALRKALRRPCRGPVEGQAEALRKALWKALR
eukprot:15110103-Alexandrium_andersonii.AAC.1